MKMNRPGRIAILIMAFLLLMVFAESSDAAVVEGKLQRQDSQGNVTPASGISVTVSDAKGQRSVAAASNSEGLYYIPNVTPGTYRLEIWAKPKAPPMTFEIQVGAEPATSVAPINIP
jgi:hypothetical protein